MYHMESCEKDQEASELIKCKICNTFMQMSKDTLIKYESGVRHKKKIMNANKQPKIKDFLNALNEKEKFVRIYTKLNLPFSKEKKIFCDNMLDLLKILKNIPDKKR